MTKTASYASWTGYAFENVCYKHIEQIIRYLRLASIGCLVSHWEYKPTSNEKDQTGAQVDLLLDREDAAVTLCEIKYSSEPFIIDKSYAKVLVNKIDVFEKQQKKLKQVFLAFITNLGLKKNAWSQELVHQTITLEDLFSESR